MKALIWFCCVLVLAIVMMIIKESGIILGGIPTAILYGTAVFTASKLCKKWEANHPKNS